MVGLLGSQSRRRKTVKIVTHSRGECAKVHWPAEHWIINNDNGDLL